jgi:predicted O-methyltransferase YrrM
MNSDYFKFCPQLFKILSDRTTITEDGRRVSVSGASTLNNLWFLREMLVKRKYTSTLEVGLAYGASALTILATLREVHAGNAQFHHTAIDPYQSRFWGNSALCSIKAADLDKCFTLHEDFSAFVMPSLLSQKHKYDLIYIDGSHAFENVFLDLFFAARLLEIGGIVVFDDCSHPQVAKAVRYLRRNYEPFFSKFNYPNHKPQSQPITKRIGNALGIRQLRAFQKNAEVPWMKWTDRFRDF